MRPTNCTRYTFDLGGETFNYSALRRYVCNACGGAVTHRAVWDEAQDQSLDKVACAQCGGEDIISEWKYDKQVSDGLELKQSPLYRHHMNQTKKGGAVTLKDIERAPRLKRIETIRLGWTEQSQSSGKDYPVASDHFVLTDAPTLAEIYPEPPKSLPIYFPFRTFEENIEASYSVWVGGRKDAQGKHKGGFRVCQGDGEFVQSALPFKTSINQKNGQVRVNRAPGPRLVSWGNAAVDFKWDDHAFKEGERVPCPGRKGGLYTHCDACGPSILVKVRMRDARVARFGYWQISTQSINNYLHFMSVWDELTDEGKVPLPMSEVPFVLSIEPGSALYQNQKDQSWGTREAYFLKLELDPTIAKLEQKHREQRIIALLSGRSFSEPMVLLPSEGEDLPFGDLPIEEGAYDETLVEGDPFLEGDGFVMRPGDYSGAKPDEGTHEVLREEAEAAPPTSQEPAPNNLTHKNIVDLAVDLPGYGNEGRVKQAMLDILGAGWNRSTEWSPKDVWAQLQDHVRAPA